MNKTLKYTTALGSAMFALAFAVTVASADTSLVNTGDNATIDSGSTLNTTVSVSNSNSASISQSSFSMANTGGNYTDGNIGGGDIDSGNAVVSTDLEATANQNQTGIALAGSTSGNGDVEVINTGDDLTVTAGNDVNTYVAVSNSNELESEQEAWSMANTGLNSASDNINGGDVMSGNAGVSTSFEVEANVNKTALDLSDLYSGGGSDLSFVNTGDGANVDFGDVTNATVSVSSVNSARIDQRALSMANSGMNRTEDNIGGGDVMSGNAATLVDFEVKANQNQTGIELGSLLSGLTGNDVEVTNTGDDLVVTSGTTVNTTATASSTNSAAVVQTSVEVSNSGFNFGFDNINGGDLDSGNAGTSTDFMSGVNWNLTLFE